MFLKDSMDNQMNLIKLLNKDGYYQSVKRYIMDRFGKE